MTELEQLATKLAKDIRTLKELQVSDVYTPDYHLAMGLISLGYRNVKDNVHSRREWYQIGYKDAQKKTAREILKKGNEYLMNANDKAVAFACFLGMLEHDYGVEVKEL